MNTPELRFPEFNEEWVTMKLGNLGKFLGGGTPSTKNSNFWNGDIPWISSSDLTEENIYQINSVRFITKDAISQSATKLIPANSILIVSRVGVGKVAVNKTELCTSQDFTNLVACTENVVFLAYLIKVETKCLLEFNQGTSIKGFVKSDLVALELKLPLIPEQTRIAAFLSAIDEKLSQLKKRKTLLEQYKKGVMQKIFSQVISFKSEEGKEFSAWTKSRLDKIIVRFIVPMRDKPKHLEGEIPWCRIEDFTGKYLSGSKSSQGVTIKTIKEMNLKVYPVNTLLVSCSANLGFCAIVKKELITNQTFIGLVPDESKVNIEFLYYVMILSSRKLNILSSGTTISYLSREQFERFEIILPCLEEQTPIANFLSAIDEKINHCSAQIEKTELWKKGLLQKMFV